MDFDKIVPKPKDTREALTALFDYNDTKHNPSSHHLEGGELWSDGREYVRDKNYEMLANLADLLGMPDLYMEDNNH